MIWSGRRSDVVSMPLAKETIGVPGVMCGARMRMTLSMNWTGMQMAMSLASVRAELGWWVTLTDSSMVRLGSLSEVLD